MNSVSIYHYITRRIITINPYSPEWGCIVWDATGETDAPCAIQSLLDPAYRMRRHQSSVSYVFANELANDNHEYRQPGAENWPSVSRPVAESIAFCSLLAEFYVKHANHTVLPVSVYIQPL